MGADVGGAVASWLVRSSPDQVVWVKALAGVTALCSWARHLRTFTPIATAHCYYACIERMLRNKTKDL